MVKFIKNYEIHPVKLRDRKISNKISVELRYDRITIISDSSTQDEFQQIFLLNRYDEGV